MEALETEDLSPAAQAKKKADKTKDKTTKESEFRKEFRRLNDDDSYELGVKLKQWFNKNVL